jgi:hypothetical protein
VYAPVAGGRKDRSQEKSRFPPGMTTKRNDNKRNNNKRNNNKVKRV